MKPTNSTLEWKPALYADGIYWELQYEQGYFVLFSRPNESFEITSGHSWEIGGKKVIGAIEDCEMFAFYVRCFGARKKGSIKELVER